MALRNAPGGIDKRLQAAQEKGLVEDIGNIIKEGDQALHMKLMDDFQGVLDLGSGLGWRTLARYGSEAVQHRLLDGFADKLDTKTFCVGEGWLLLSVYGKASVKIRLTDQFPDKLDLSGSQHPDPGERDKGAGWDNIARYGPDSARLDLVLQHKEMLDRNGGRGWRLLAMNGGDSVKMNAKFLGGITRS